MSTLSQAKDMFRMQQQAKKIKKQLKKVHIEAESEGVLVIVNGEQEVVSITIAQEVDRDRIPNLLTGALNRAMKKAQVVAAEQMQEVMGGLGLPTGRDEGMKSMSH
ncbi:MAG: YbaB/EbfC family nucleoid-associated protein [bacterium]|nr:YbaB/EbfC family nucleoid-associated protein [bacterium]